MAKKQKRRVSSSNGERTAAKPTFRASTSTEFNPDYSDVIKDLRQIGIMASGFFIVLIVLSFILN